MIVHVRSEGSHWFFKSDGGQPKYMRMPINEGPREEPYKEMSEGTVLEDFQWHPMVTWAIVNRQLRILYQAPDGTEKRIVAPDAEILSREK